MELAWSAAEAAFRDEVRALLDEKLTPELRRAGTLATSVYSDHEASMEWQQILHERGWAAPAWPVEHGGCDWTQTQHYIFGRESVLAGAPTLSPMGIRMVAHAIIAYGTQEQKDFFLPGILTGEVFFCQATPNRSPGRIWRHSRWQRSTTATTSSSPAARSGRRTPPKRTGCSRSCVRRSPTRSSTESRLC